MIKISKNTFFDKKLFPSIWFSFLGIFLVASFSSSNLKGAAIGAFFVLLMAAFGFFLYRKLIWELADEVFDRGDALVFRKGKSEQIVKLTEIINIEYSHLVSPERVTIYTRNPGPLGDELAFSPPFRFNIFSKSPLVKDLIRRVDEARNT